MLRPGYGDVSIAVNDDANIGERVTLSPFVNIYGCTIGDDTKIGAYVEIAEGVTIGKRCKIAPGALMGPGLTIGDDCYIGPNVIFANVRNPTSGNGQVVEETRVGNGVSIGASCVILPGLIIGSDCVVGAGTIVTKNVPEGWGIRHALETVLLQ